MKSPRVGTFIGEALKNIGSIGALAPCSPAAAEKMVQSITFKTARVIVEFGGGTGPVTREILKRAHPDARIFVFEINDTFVEELKKISDPRLNVVHDSATHVRKVLEEFGIESADCVISTLPLAVMKPDLVNAIFTATKDILKTGGVYTQIQYSPILKKRLKREFGEIETLFTPRNVPPAFVYVAKK